MHQTAREPSNSAVRRVSWFIQVRSAGTTRGFAASVRTVALLCALLLVVTKPAIAQEEDFRRSRTTLGLGVGIYTFNGPVDLWKPRSYANFVRKKDPALVANIQFPVTRSRLYLRPQIGYTASDRNYGRTLLISGENEFIVNDLAWFETDLVLMLRSPRHRIVPYLFGGVGLLLADPFGRTNDHRESIPAEHVKRTQAYFPVGVGIDIAMTRRASIYLESALHLSRNSVFLDRAEPDPFNTTLFLAGVRFSLGSRPAPAVASERRPICPICPLPPASWEEPLAALGAMGEKCCACAIEDLQSVTFARNSAALDPEARARLRENVDALNAEENFDCSLMVVGYYDPHEDVDVGRRRAATVVAFYFDLGLNKDKIKLGDAVPGIATCDSKGGLGECVANQRAVTEPYCAFGPVCSNPFPPPRYSPLQNN